MSSLLLLIPVAILLVFVASATYLWAVKNRQFEDLEREGERILFDDSGLGSPQHKKNPVEETVGNNSNER